MIIGEGDQISSDLFPFQSLRLIAPNPDRDLVGRPRDPRSSQSGSMQRAARNHENMRGGEEEERRKKREAILGQ